MVESVDRVVLKIVDRSIIVLNSAGTSDRFLEDHLRLEMLSADAIQLNPVLLVLLSSCTICCGVVVDYVLV